MPLALDMTTTRLLRCGDSQAVHIPDELAYSSFDMDMIIERYGDELRIRPAQRRMGNILAKFAKFTSDFMSGGREHNQEVGREAL